MSVSILIDDKPVEMYKVQVKDNKATCYIESIEGKELKIQNKILQSFLPYGVAFFGEVDGSKVDGILSPRPEKPSVIDGAYISAFQKRPFMFSKINLTDNPDLASNDETFIKNLGLIKVTALRGKETGPLYKSNKFEGAVDNRAIDERSKKANVSHQVGFGAAKMVTQRKRVPMTWIDSMSSPYVTFEIKYLSRNLLELQDIVKPLVPVDQDTTPSTSSSSRAKSSKKRKASNFTINKDGALVLSDDSDDEEESLLAKVARLEAENKRLRGGEEIIKVKKEKGESSIVKVKKEKVVIELD
ncbi:hypothetical protein JCM5353_002975 [Sporobolomyces roseus]